MMQDIKLYGSELRNLTAK